MPTQPFVIWLAVGVVVGLLADPIVKSSGFGRVGNLAIAILGAAVGGWLLGGQQPVFSNGFVGAVFGAALGAVLLLLVVPLVRRAG